MQHLKKSLGLAASLGLALSSSPLLAAEYEINTFLSIGGALSDATATQDPQPQYLQAISKNISLEYDSRYGVNLRTQVTENIEGAAQLLANGRNGTFDLEAEWFYASYSLGNNVRVRVGKLNLQTFLLSDYIEVGNLYPWVRPPEEVYGLNPMRNFPGVELMHISRFGRSTLTSQFFIGSAQVDISSVTRFKAKDGFGINFQLDNPNFTLRLGGITPVVELAQTPAPGFNGGIYNEGDRMYMVTAGYSFDVNNFIGYGEYISVTAEGETGRIFPDQTGYYVTFGYQMGKYLPFFTVAANDGSSAYAFMEDPSSPAADYQPNPLVIQQSLSLGLRYDINDYADVKFEIKSVDPTLDPALPPGFAFNAGWSIGPNQLEEKYTVYTLIYDMVF